MHKNDHRTPIMPPIPPGHRPMCEDPPDEAEILRAMPRVTRGVPYVYEEFRDDIEMTVEKIVDKIDPPRFFPLVGPAQLHHCHWKCTIYYTETQRVELPVPVQDRCGAASRWSTSTRTTCTCASRRRRPAARDARHALGPAVTPPSTRRHGARVLLAARHHRGKRSKRQAKQRGHSHEGQEMVRRLIAGSCALGAAGELLAQQPLPQNVSPRTTFPRRSARR